MSGEGKRPSPAISEDRAAVIQELRELAREWGNQGEIVVGTLLDAASALEGTL